METKLVIVMRKDLNMRKGKMIAQGAHAATAWITRRLVFKDCINDSNDFEYEYSCCLKTVELDWLHSSFKKICVYVNSKEELMDIHKAAELAGLESNVICDAGHTEVKPNTYTCLSIGPDLSDKIDKITGHLPLL